MREAALAASLRRDAPLLAVHPECHFSEHLEPVDVEFVVVVKPHLPSMVPRDKFAFETESARCSSTNKPVLEPSCPCKRCQHPVNSFFTTFLRKRHWESQWKISKASSCLSTQCFAPCWDTGRTSCAACIVPTLPIPKIPKTTGPSFTSSVRVPSTGTRWKSAM
jgi:hypothetical protein